VVANCNLDSDATSSNSAAMLLTSFVFGSN
jgi:hypothetical protein